MNPKKPTKKSEDEAYLDWLAEQMDWFETGYLKEIPPCIEGLADPDEI